MSTILVVGGNRGIGLELVRQLRERGDRVITTCRRCTDALRRLDVEVITDIDVSEAHSIESLKRSIRDITLDTLIHSCGILTRESLDDMDIERIVRQFTVNTLGPLRVAHGLHGNIRNGGKLAILSSRMGSIADNTSGGMYGYRISKAAVNAAGMSLARDLAQREIAVALLHPGLVATEMTGYRGIEPRVAACGLIDRIDALDMQNSGMFYHAEGYELPW